MCSYICWNSVKVIKSFFFACDPQVKRLEKCIRLVPNIVCFMHLYLTIQLRNGNKTKFNLFQRIVLELEEVVSKRLFTSTFFFQVLVQLQACSTNAWLFTSPARKRMWQCTQSKLITIGLEEKNVNKSLRFFHFSCSLEKNQTVAKKFSLF